MKHKLTNGVQEITVITDNPGYIMLLHNVNCINLTISEAELLSTIKSKHIIFTSTTKLGDSDIEVELLDDTTVSVHQDTDHMILTSEQLQQLSLILLYLNSKLPALSNRQIVIMFIAAMMNWQVEPISAVTMDTMFQNVASDNNLTIEEVKVYYDKFNHLIDWVSENLPNN